MCTSLLERLFHKEMNKSNITISYYFSSNMVGKIKFVMIEKITNVLPLVVISHNSYT